MTLTDTCVYCERTFTVENPCWNDDGCNADNSLHLYGECCRCAEKHGNVEAQRFLTADNAKRFNDMLWGDTRMLELQEAIANAGAAVGPQSKGWGLLALEMAEGDLRLALEHLEYLKTLELGMTPLMSVSSRASELSEGVPDYLRPTLRKDS